MYRGYLSPLSSLTMSGRQEQNILEQNGLQNCGEILHSGQLCATAIP
jgi:hypothetical protein